MWIRRASQDSTIPPSTSLQTQVYRALYDFVLNPQEGEEEQLFCNSGEHANTTEVYIFKYIDCELDGGKENTDRYL